MELVCRIEGGCKKPHCDSWSRVGRGVLCLSSEVASNTCNKHGNELATRDDGGGNKLVEAEQRIRLAHLRRDSQHARFQVLWWFSVICVEYVRAVCAL